MSQKLYLDFLAIPSFSCKRISTVSTCLAATAFISTILVLQAFKDAQQKQIILQTAQHIVLPGIKKDINKTVLKPLPKNALKQANETAHLLNVPWHALFSAIEAIPMQDVALLSIKPSLKKQQLLLTGQAKDMQALLHYVAQVEKLPMLQATHLQKHIVETDQPFKPVSFTIMAKWL
jgi:hypothetical protein